VIVPATYIDARSRHYLPIVVTASLVAALNFLDDYRRTPLEHAAA
jgi:hypothetical protein